MKNNELKNVRKKTDILNYFLIVFNPLIMDL